MTWLVPGFKVSKKKRASDQPRSQAFPLEIEKALRTRLASDAKMVSLVGCG